MEHRRLQESIPALAAGRLAPADAELLKSHLETCESCRELAEDLGRLAGAIREKGQAMFDPHPSVAELHDHAAGRNEAASPAILRHLEVCATCELEVAVRAGSGVARPASGFRRTRLLAAVAAIFVLGLALGAWFAGAVRTDAPSPGSAPAGAIFLSPLRTPRLLGPFVVDPVEPYVALVVPVILPSETSAEVEYRFRIATETGSDVWSMEASARRIRRLMLDHDAVTLFVPTEALPPGVYEMAVAPARASPGTDVVLRVEFEVSGPN